MKRVAWLWLCIAAWGQQPQPPAAEKPAAPQEQKATDGASESPVPTTDRWVTGSVDLGYRWRTGPGGNENVYRSIVDLGEGPKLLDADFSIVDPKHRWFDRIDTRAANWGDDPYTTLNVTARKNRVYDFVSSYRNLASFNNLPSFANPLLSRGVLSSERTFDMRNRMSSFDLSILPGNWLVPYFAYDRASGYGNGVTTFVSDLNEYPVPFKSNFSQNNMRGGLRIELNRYHVTVEQGGTTFRDDQSLFQSPGGNNPGNRETPYLGNALFLDGLSQAYGVRGNSVYTKVIATAQPAAWLSLYGQFLYARPQNETNYQQFNSGNFTLQPQAVLFTSQQYILSSAAKTPHQSGQLGAELRLHPRVRILTNWMTDRIRVSGENLGEMNPGGNPAAEQVDIADSTQLRNDYNHFEADVLWDVTSRLTLRGGYRYQWGRTSNFLLPPAGLASSDMADFKRNIAKGGASYRLGARLSVTADFEGAGTEAAYYRTSLYGYQRGRLQGFYQATSQLTFSAVFSAVNNQNSAPAVDYDYLGMQTSASVLWNPAGDKRIGFQGTYTRATIRSDIIYLVPQTFQQDRSRYNDNGHSIQGMFNVAIPRLRQVRFTAGGDFFISSGSRSTNYFQPVGKLIVPVSHAVAWISQWSYYGYAESFYSFEGFRSHLITTGLRITR